MVECSLRIERVVGDDFKWFDFDKIVGFGNVVVRFLFLFNRVG